MSQTTVSEFRDKYIVGDIQDPTTAVTSVKVVDDSTNIKPGDVVIVGSTEDEVSGVTAAWTQANFRGIAVYGGLTNEKALSTGVNTYSDNQPITILRSGTIPVLLGGTVTEGQDGFFVHTAGGASALHTWRADLDTDKASQVGGVFLQGGSSGEVVLFRLEWGAQISTLMS